MTPQQRLVEAILAPAALREVAPAEWESLLACARRNTVLAYLAHRCATAGVIDDVPEAVREAMLSAQTAAGRLAQLARFELDRTRRVLEPAGIPVIALKGAAYLLRGLPHAATRLLSDVDIMVPAGRIDDAERLLLAGGWKHTKLDPYDQAYYRRWSHEIPPLQFPNRLLSVDVHHTICPPVSRLRPDPARFWAGAVASPIAGIRVLSPVDSVLHAAVHLFFDSDFDTRFRDLVDLNEMFVTFGAAEGFWTELEDVARAQGLTRPLHYAVATCARVLRTPVPSSLAARLDREGPPWPVDRWMKWALATLLAPVDARRWPRANRGLVWLMYVRSHWLRMPPHLLVPHLMRKAWRRGGAAPITAEQQR